jgi:hypothetical protein
LVRERHASSAQEFVHAREVGHHGRQIVTARGQSLDPCSRRVILHPIQQVIDLAPECIALLC